MVMAERSSVDKPLSSWVEALSGGLFEEACRSPSGGRLYGGGSVDEPIGELWGSCTHQSRMLETIEEFDQSYYYELNGLPSRRD
jgi:hypothetical protein